MSMTEQVARERKQRFQSQKDIMGFVAFLILMGTIFWFFAPDEVRHSIYLTLFSSSDSGVASLTTK